MQIKSKGIKWKRGINREGYTHTTWAQMIALLLGCNIPSIGAPCPGPEYRVYNKEVLYLPVVDMVASYVLDYSSSIFFRSTSNSMKYFLSAILECHVECRTKVYGTRISRNPTENFLMSVKDHHGAGHYKYCISGFLVVR